MDWLIWVGAGISALGLLGLVYCIVKVAGAKRAGLSDDEMRDAVRRVVPLNMGAFLLSVMGLGMVVVGVILGGS